MSTFVDSWPPWFIRFLIGKGLKSPDELPVPPGYSSWGEYFVLEGYTMTDYNPLGGPPAEGAKCNMIWSRDGEDVATCGFHFVHANPDVLGDTIAWDPVGDCDTIETLLTTLWNALKGHYHSTIQLDRFAWHHFGEGIRRPNPAFKDDRFTGLPGTSATVALPPQVAVSVTFKTDRRKSWGRVYFPAPTLEVIVADADARIDPTVVADFRTAFGTMLDGAAGAHLPLTVWCPRHAGVALQYGDAAHTANLDEPDSSSLARGVVTIQVDDLFDVIRRRRFDTALVKDTHTLGA